jgi:hypothetical protein
VALLRFTNPTDIPAYGGWDFPVFAAEFALRVQDMRDVFAAYLDNHRLFHSNIPNHWGRYAEAKRVAGFEVDWANEAQFWADEQAVGP